mmetsp:Transcript_20508/g.50997  ORF Transcript_20508/g.50997 Transcript_20508/m.50997 type:complete len:96 (-) Transcript_20508:63-350(-)
MTFPATFSPSSDFVERDLRTCLLVPHLLPRDTEQLFVFVKASTELVDTRKANQAAKEILIFLSYFGWLKTKVICLLRTGSLCDDEKIPGLCRLCF